MENNLSTPPQIDLNQADLETLTTLPGIGPALAARIIRFREEVHPFEEAIDVIAVPGISEKMYHQFADRVTVSPLAGQAIVAASLQIAPASDDQGPETETDIISTEMEEVQEMPPETKDKIALPPVENPPATSMAAPQPRDGSVWRLWLAAIVAAIGGALLALLVLHSINGTLNMATHPQVLHLNNQVADLNKDIGELRDRLNQMEALSGRLQNAEAEIEALNEQITTLEQGVRQVQADLQTLNEELSTHSEQIAAIEQDTAQIQETVDQIEAAVERFDNFLSGLRDLLLATEETATPTAPSSASPTPTERVEPTYTPTVSPATPAAATATRTPRPTRTPTPTPTVSGL